MPVPAKEAPVLNALLVDYSGGGEPEAAECIRAKLRRLPESWECLETTWLVGTELSATELSEELGGALRDGDSLAILDLSSGFLRAIAIS